MSKKPKADVDARGRLKLANGFTYLTVRGRDVIVRRFSNGRTLIVFPRYLSDFTGSRQRKGGPPQSAA